MAIKTGDRVKFHGRTVRVMKCGGNMRDPSFRLPYFGWIDGDLAKNLELVESTPDTTLKNGDEVIIRNIPRAEKDDYGVIWLSEMENLMMSGEIHTVKNVRYNDQYGWIGNIGGYVFHLYHIESINNFDMI